MTDAPGTRRRCRCCTAPCSSIRREVRGAMPLQVEAVGRVGSSTVYEGVPLADLLREAGVMPVERLRCASLRQYVVASDGFRAVLALAEADSSCMATPVLVAHEANGAPLAEGHGRYLEYHRREVFR